MVHAEKHREITGAEDICTVLSKCTLLRAKNEKSPCVTAFSIRKMRAQIVPSFCSVISILF